VLPSFPGIHGLDLAVSILYTAGGGETLLPCWKWAQAAGTLEKSPRQFSHASLQPITIRASDSGQRRGHVVEPAANRPTTLGDYLAILGRRKWIIITLPLVAAIAAVVSSSSQTPLYRAKAEVLVRRSSIVTSVTNVQDPSLGDPTRFLTTQSSIARDPELAARVVAAAGIPGLTADGFLGESSVAPEANADLLDIFVSDRHPRDAVLLANTYATELSKYKTELDTEQINEAVKALQKRAQALRASGGANSVAYATLLQYQGTLVTVGKLLASNTRVLQPAAGAPKVSPRPRRSGILGALFGGILGIGLALLAETLDRRVRSEQEIEETVGLPLLGRIPRPGRRLRKRTELALLSDPRSVDAETYRKLRTSIEFVNIDRGAQTIMVTSGVQQEGKSTTIANLAVAFARAGRRVALVDLDLRRPLLHRFFHVGSAPGLSDVAMRRMSLAEATRTIALGHEHASFPKGANGGRPAFSPGANGKSQVEGVLHLLPAGTLPPSPSEFLEDTRVAGVLAELATEFDLVLVDAPPLLAFGDAMSLSAHVDAMFVVVRLNVVQRPTLRELARQLENCRAAKLGFVLTGVSHADTYRYGYEAYGYDVRAPAERTADRT
jgi:succinoglycan biosynthesis transport protein ExoP